MTRTAAQPARKRISDKSRPVRLLLLERAATGGKLELLTLRRAGLACTADTVCTRAQFLDHLRHSRHDVVLSDYWLTGWTGLDALAAMRQMGYELPLILITDALGEERAVECIERGTAGYVLKKNIARLPVVISRALEEHSLRSSRSKTSEQSDTGREFLFANHPLPLWIFDATTHLILQVNDAALAHYGYEREDFLRLHASDLHTAEELPRWLKTLQDDTGMFGHAQRWHHRKNNGSIVEVESLLHRMEYSGSGAVLAMVRDVAETANTAKETQKFFTLVENSRDFIAVADLNGNILYVNPCGRDLLGVNRAACVTESRAEDYLAAEDQSLVQQAVLPAVFAAGHWQGELRFRHHVTGESLHLDCLIFLIKDASSGEPQFLATVSRDLSERRALEEQLQQAQKFEAIGRLAGGMAHDFNNVIAAIQGWAEVGTEHGATDSALGVPYFQKIHSQCDRATALIRQLLAFARRQLLEPRNINLNQVVRDVLGLLDAKIDKTIKTETLLADDLASIHADPTQIEQVLMNLLINARDAMPAGGHLFIETHNTLYSDEDCRGNTLLQPGRFAELSVRDTGTGMNAAVRQRIFEPFFTTKAAGKGTGLGLATVYGIVKQHGGCIRVESHPGLGSTFHVYFPIPTDESLETPGTAVPQR